MMSVNFIFLFNFHQMNGKFSLSKGNIADGINKLAQKD